MAVYMTNAPPPVTFAPSLYQSFAFSKSVDFKSAASHMFNTRQSYWFMWLSSVIVWCVRWL